MGAEWMALKDCEAGEILISAEIVDDVEVSNDQPLSLTSDKSNDEAEIKTIIILEKKAGKSLAEDSQDGKDDNVSAPTEEISDVETVSTRSEPEAEKETRKEGSTFAGEPVIHAGEKTVTEASIEGDQEVEEVKISFDVAEDDDKSMVSAEAKDGTTTEMKYEEDSARWDLSPERIELIVHAARDLPKKGMFGKADPYVVISLGDQKLKSATMNNTYNPQWDLKTTLHVQENAPRDISIVVLDEDVGKDDLVGEIFLNIDDLVKVGGLKDAWVPLGGCKSGEVQISSSIVWEGDQSTNTDSQNLSPQTQHVDQKSKSPTPTILITSAPDAQVDLSDDDEEHEVVADHDSVIEKETHGDTSLHQEDQVKDSKTVVGTIEDPAISLAAKEVVDSVTSQAVEKVAAMAKAEEEEKQKEKQAALEDPKMISAARKVVDQATSEAVEKVAAMQAGHPAVVIGEPEID